MFIVCIDGGLGNQMFEYAFSLALQNEIPEVTVEYDLSVLDTHIHNGYELERVFGLKLKQCQLKEVARCAEFVPKGIKGHSFLTLCYRLRRYLFGTKYSYIHPDDHTIYYKKIFLMDVLHSYYFQGVWANEQYFRNIKEKVLEVFQFQGEMNEQNRRYLEEIRKMTSISIHIRRGDYKESGSFLDASYYIAAVRFMEEHVPNPVYFVFSDEENIVDTILPEAGNYSWIKGNTGEKSYIDMWLMSECKHNIIANSTFSFWGAYLNKNKEKIVVAPKCGFANNRNSFSCQEWVKL